MTAQAPSSPERILATRFFPPPLPATRVCRERLVNLMNAGLSARLMLVSASAGFGKSILVSEWMQSRLDIRSAWLSLEFSENDWGRFFRYFVSAWQQIFPQAGQTALMELHTSPAIQHETLCDALLNDLLSMQGEGEAVVALDDYHRIEAGDIHQSLIYLVDHLPPRCHLVLITRVDPPLPLARWRSRGCLSEVRTDELRFNSAESVEYLNRCMGLRLGREEIEILDTRTEGWAVGLQLAGLSLQGRDHTEEFVRTFGGSHRYVLDYLVEEVVNQQPEEVQSFLLTTAHLEQFCASLCDALLGTRSPYSQSLLEHLEKANLFIIALDDQRGWYRYHHLFADLLRVRQQRADPKGNPALMQRAALWFAGNHLWHEAIRYAQDAQDFTLAADICAEAIREGGVRFLYSGIYPLVARFPSRWIADNPVFALMKAAAMIERSQLAGIEVILRSAEQGIQDDLLGMVYVTQSVAASLLGDSRWIVEASQQVLQRLPDQVDARVHALVQLGNLDFYRGNLHEVDARWTEALGVSLAIPYPNGIHSCLDNLGRLCCQKGELKRAEAFFQRALSYLEKQPSPRWLFETQRDLADLLRETNHLCEAHEMMSASLKSGERWAVPSGIGLGYLVMGRILLAEGDLRGAESMLQKTEALCREYTVYPDLEATVAVYRSRLLLETNSPEKALELVQDALNKDWCEHEFHREWMTIAQARVLLRANQANNALALLNGRIETAEQNGQGQNWLESCLLMALAHEAKGNTRESFKSLQSALVYAQQNGFLRVWVDEGNAMQALLKKYIRAFPKSSYERYVTNILRAFPVSAGIKAGEALIEPLSARELEILALVCQGGSNQEIARQLMLSIGTVKTHIHHIFGKLGVNNRPQAIARARHLNMVNEQDGL